MFNLEIGVPGIQILTHILVLLFKIVMALC